LRGGTAILANESLTDERANAVKKKRNILLNPKTKAEKRARLIGVSGAVLGAFAGLAVARDDSSTLEKAGAATTGMLLGTLLVGGVDLFVLGNKLP